MTLPLDQMACFEVSASSPIDSATNYAPVSPPTGQSKFVFVGDFIIAAQGNFDFGATTVQGRRIDFNAGYISGGGFDGGGPGYGVSILLPHDGSGSNFMQAFWGPIATPLGSQFHLEIVADTQAGTCAAYENGVAMTRTGFFAGAPPHFNVDQPTDLFIQYGSDNPDPVFGCANNVGLYVGATAPAGAPYVYLSIPPGGVANDFLTNEAGTAGPFLHGHMHLCSECFDVTVPPPAVTLALDDVLVTAEAGSPPCLISLEWSNDRGHSFGNPVSQPMGGTGEYGKTLTWQRLGYARDRVWKLQWSCPSATALLGAWIEVTPEGKGQG